MSHCLRSAASSQHIQHANQLIYNLEGRESRAQPRDTSQLLGKDPKFLLMLDILGHQPSPRPRWTQLNNRRFISLAQFHCHDIPHILNTSHILAGTVTDDGRYPECQSQQKSAAILTDMGGS